MTASVAADTSAVKLFGVTATAVRHTPLTAMLPPTASGAIVGAAELDDEPAIRAVIRARRDSPDAFHQSREHALTPARAQAPATLLTRAVIRKSAPTLRKSSNTTLQLVGQRLERAARANMPRAESPSNRGAI